MPLPWKDILWSRQPKPELEEGEETLLEGRAGFRGGLFGGSIGSLVLTDRRIIWYEPAAGRPFRPIHGEVRLSEIVSVDKGNVLDAVIGGGCLRLHLRNGKDKRLIEVGGKLDEWIEAIRKALKSESE
jgi:hypothetical protein